MSVAIHTRHAPEFPLPFSQALVAGDFVYISGQVGVDPATRQVIGDTIEEQTTQTRRNIETILHTAGLTLDHIVKIQSYLARPEDVPGYNEAYRRLLKEPFPARTTITCGIGSYLIEIDAIAYAPAVRTGAPARSEA